MKYPELFTSFSKISPLNIQEWLDFEKMCTEQHFKKGEHVLQVGETADKVSILLNGGVRFYYLGQDGEEFNRGFKFSGAAISSYTSLQTGEPSLIGIQALEDCLVLNGPFAQFSSLLDSTMNWQRLGRKMAEQHYIGKEKREHAFLTMNATARYEQMLQQYPGIEDRVPQFHLASYLGITASALNRIIKK